jgi:hypothetical protein
MSKRKPNWTDREKMILMEEYEKRKDVLRARFSATIYLMVKYEKLRSFKYLVKEPLKIFYEYYLSIFLTKEILGKILV